MNTQHARILLPSPQLVLGRTWPKRTKGPLFLSSQFFLSHLPIVHIITIYYKGSPSKIQNSFSPIQPSHAWPLMSLGHWFFSLVFLHDFMFKATYNTLIIPIPTNSVIPTNSAIPLNFTKNPNFKISNLMFTIGLEPLNWRKFGFKFWFGWIFLTFLLLACSWSLTWRKFGLKF